MEITRIFDRMYAANGQLASVCSGPFGLSVFVCLPAFGLVVLLHQQFLFKFNECLYLCELYQE